MFFKKELPLLFLVVGAFAIGACHRKEPRMENDPYTHNVSDTGQTSDTTANSATVNNTSDTLGTYQSGRGSPSPSMSPSMTPSMSPSPIASGRYR